MYYIESIIYTQELSRGLLRPERPKLTSSRTTWRFYDWSAMSRTEGPESTWHVWCGSAMSVFGYETAVQRCNSLSLTLSKVKGLWVAKLPWSVLHHGCSTGCWQPATSAESTRFRGGAVSRCPLQANPPGLRLVLLVGQLISAYHYEIWYDMIW